MRRLALLPSLMIVCGILFCSSSSFADPPKEEINIENINGSKNDDTITGDNDKNILKGNAGDDKISGNAGNDIIYGGTGKDILDGGLDDDSLYAEGGDDTLTGSDGKDLLDGGTSDTLGDTAYYTYLDSGTNKIVVDLTLSSNQAIVYNGNIASTTDIDQLTNIENIKSIPGVSVKTVSAILGECGDLRRFESAKAFIGFLGLYPTLYQSGKSFSSGALAKRGIPIAKHALYMAAVSSVRHNTELHKLFRDKVSAGKSKKEALIIIAKKLASIIYSLFKYNQPYKPQRVLIQHKR